MYYCAWPAPSTSKAGFSSSAYARRSALPQPISLRRAAASRLATCLNNCFLIRIWASTDVMSTSESGRACRCLYRKDRRSVRRTSSAYIFLPACGQLSQFRLFFNFLQGFLSPMNILYDERQNLSGTVPGAKMHPSPHPVPHIVSPRTSTASNQQRVHRSWFTPMRLQKSCNCLPHTSDLDLSWAHRERPRSRRNLGWFSAVLPSATSPRVCAHAGRPQIVCLTRPMRQVATRPFPPPGFFFFIRRLSSLFVQ